MLRKKLRLDLRKQVDANPAKIDYGRKWKFILVGKRENAGKR